MTIASIDIGTNTVLLLIAEVDLNSRKIKSILNEQRIPRIGKGLIPGNPVSEDKVKLLMEILEEYSGIINKFNCEKVIAAGTNALRIASNSDLIIEEVKRKFNFDIRVITGNDEAETAFAGASFDFQDKDIMVIDIGGGSTEISLGKNKKINFSRSFQVGVVSGTEKFLLSDPPSDKELINFYNFLDQIWGDVKRIISPEHVIAIAGTPTTLACIKQNLTEYNEEAIEGSSLSIENINSLIEELKDNSSVQIKKKYKAVVEGREDLILAGTIILKSIMNNFKIKAVTVSTKGIRYGLIVKEFFRD